MEAGNRESESGHTFHSAELLLISEGVKHMLAIASDSMSSSIMGD